MDRWGVSLTIHLNIVNETRTLVFLGTSFLWRPCPRRRYRLAVLDPQTFGLLNPESERTPLSPSTFRSFPLLGVHDVTVWPPYSNWIVSLRISSNTLPSLFSAVGKTKIHMLKCSINERFKQLSVRHRHFWSLPISKTILPPTMLIRVLLNPQDTFFVRLVFLFSSFRPSLSFSNAALKMCTTQSTSNGERYAIPFLTDTNSVYSVHTSSAIQSISPVLCVSWILSAVVISILLNTDVVFQAEHMPPNGFLPEVPERSRKWDPANVC